MASTTTPAHLTEFAGPVIITRYRGQTDNRDARIMATHRRGDDETHRLYGPYRQGLESTENHRAAALALAVKMAGEPRALIVKGHDDGAYYWVSVGLWQLEPWALALEACRLLEVAAAGGADAAALALPVALARMATGTDRPRRVITGAICRGDGVAVTDHLGREVCRMPGRCSTAGALAAAAAAGWPLGAAAAATAARHQGPPDPGAVADAMAARGECPAAIAALRATAAAGVAS